MIAESVKIRAVTGFSRYNRGNEIERRGGGGTPLGMVERHRRSHDMRSIRIPLYSRNHPGRFAVIDEDDLVAVSGYHWCLKKDKATWYARATRGVDGTKHPTTYMHSLILPTSPGLVADHINGDGLDNRRENLRLATNTQNSHNQRLRSTNRSGFKGVCFNQGTGKWVAEITSAGRKYRLGYYEDVLLAAIAYDIAASCLYGEFATLNLPMNGEGVALSFAVRDREVQG